jgi:predicted RNase H-like HicB family nuclease
MKGTGDQRNQLVFQIEQDDNMLVATCHEPEMATQGQTLDELIAMIRDLVQCRFDENDERLSWPIRLHFLHDPVLSAQIA